MPAPMKPACIGSCPDPPPEMTATLFAFGGVVKQKPHEALVVPLGAWVRGDKAAEGLPHEVVGGVTK